MAALGSPRGPQPDRRSRPQLFPLNELVVADRVSLGRDVRRCCSQRRAEPWKEWRSW